MCNKIHVSKIELIKKINRSAVLTCAEKDVLVHRLQHMHGSCRGIDILMWMSSVDFSSCIEAWKIYHNRSGVIKYIETFLYGEPQWDNWRWGFNAWRLNPDIVETPRLKSVIELIHILKLDRVFTFYVYCNGAALELNDQRTKAYALKKFIGISGIIDDPKSFGLILDR